MEGEGIGNAGKEKNWTFVHGEKDFRESHPGEKETSGAGLSGRGGWGEDVRGGAWSTGEAVNHSCIDGGGMASSYFFAKLGVNLPS